MFLPFAAGNGPDVNQMVLKTEGGAPVPAVQRRQRRRQKIQNEKKKRRVEKDE
jgi:hypothetical protein